jgi:peptidoglycan hydrolase CwlO-like protein
MRRPTRRVVSVGRSVGVAEHLSYTGLPRPSATRLITVACLVALACFSLAPGVAHAQSTQDRVNATRRSIDAAAQRWFDAQRKAADVNARINDIERTIADGEARVANARHVAVARALVMYEGASMEYTSMFGTSAMDVGRRAQLIDEANASNRAALDELTASLGDMRSQQKQLESERSQQQKSLDAVANERAALDAQLATLRARADGEARAAANARPHVQHRHVSATSPSVAPPTASNGGGATSGPSSPPPSGGGVSSHHDDPFLVCTRARESGGNYGAVSPSGYYGAYQFLPSTWDITGSHAGRLDLVGVLPSHASVHDQDEMAWTLYQWQGKGPWGGRC